MYICLSAYLFRFTSLLLKKSSMLTLFIYVNLTQEERDFGKFPRAHKEDPARIILTKLLTMSITSFAEELINNARAIAAPGKGILAADESTGKYKSTTFIVTGFLCLN